MYVLKNETNKNSFNHSLNTQQRKKINRFPASVERIIFISFWAKDQTQKMAYLK